MGGRISGTWKELQSVSVQLEALASGVATHTVIRAVPFSERSSSENPLEAIVGRVTAGPTKVSVANGMLEIVGSAESFHRLASFFYFDEAHTAGAHTHHEYCEGNDFIDPQSMPLCISLSAES